MPLTPAERKRRQREKERRAGLAHVLVTLSTQEIAHLRQLHVAACPDEPWGLFLRRSLVQGAKFRANRGGTLAAGQKAK